MASRILLISANRCTTPDPVFPVGLAHLNAALRQRSHETRWLDLLADAQPFQAALSEFQPQFVGVSLRNIDDVVISKQVTYFEDLAAICRQAREATGARVILGGSGFSVFPQRLLELSGADFGVQGEGERSLPALIAALETGGEWQSIPGLVFRRNGEIVANAPQAGPVEGAVEGPDRPALLVDHYLRVGGMLNVQTQRGCRFRCCYCTYPVIEGRTNRRRPPEVVADELEQLERHGAKYAFLVDSIFNSSPAHVAETCEAIRRRKLGLRWGCFLRPQGLTSELMKLMAHAGLEHIEFGSDSFCDTVLAACDKGLRFDDILRSSELAREAGLEFCHFLICGGPGETIATIETTFQNSRCLPGAVVMAVVGMRIYPGTALAARAVREGRLAPNADLLQPVYYLAAGLTEEGVFERLRVFSRRAPNWIVGDPSPEYTRLVQRLRSRGVVGPLWSYAAVLQRIMPRPVAEVPS
jgi:radical SAM superfamily enzyme YgiQ (UPF0313 family)